MKFLEAVLVLSGMIIGAGMFGIPFSFAKAGFVLGTAELVLLAGLVTLLHLLYAEIVLNTGTSHRLPGYTRIYLGKRLSFVAFAAALFSIVGTILVYILLGSVFLNSLASNFWAGSTEFFWAFMVALSSAVVILFSLRREAFINGVLSAVLIGFILFLVISLLPHVDIDNLGSIGLENFFIPYGVLFFALAGGIAVPNVVALLNRQRIKARRAIMVGTLLPAALYFLFALVVVGTAGEAVSEEAILGLKPFGGGMVTIIGSIIGFLAVYTSLIIVASNFKDLLVFDFSLSRPVAWSIAAFVPFFFYLSGFHNFIVMIGAIGAIAGGIEAALIISMYHKVRRVSSVFSYAWKFSLLLLVLAGVGYEIYKLI